ncbi:MAG: S24 family peptidase [Planctomycetota bacterium]|jgi:transcriptional regulator with XRE-family HTH domain
MEKINKIEVIGRIIRLRKLLTGERGKSKFAHLLGISPSSYNYYEKDRVPPVEILLRICEVTGTDLYWLLTGKENAAAAESGAIRQHSKVCKEGGYGLENSILQKLTSILDSNPELAGTVKAFVDLLVEKRSFEKELVLQKFSSISAKPGWIPVLGRTAAGVVGFWDEAVLMDSERAVTELEDLVKKYIGCEIVGAADGKLSVDLQLKSLLNNFGDLQANLIQVNGHKDDSIVEFIECSKIIELFPDSFALRVDGDSMSPRINDGDIVIVSPSVATGQGQIAVAHIRGQVGVTCKIVRSCDENVHLIPVNEKYETKVIPKENLLWSLSVLCHVSV